jgi:hypothetical protein
MRARIANVPRSARSCTSSEGLCLHRSCSRNRYRTCRCPLHSGTCIRRRPRTDSPHPPASKGRWGSRHRRGTPWAHTYCRGVTGRETRAHSRMRSRRRSRCRPDTGRPGRRDRGNSEGAYIRSPLRSPSPQCSSRIRRLAQGRRKASSGTRSPLDDALESLTSHCSSRSPRRRCRSPRRRCRSPRLPCSRSLPTPRQHYRSRPCCPQHCRCRSRHRGWS